MSFDISGVFCAAATPVTAEGEPDLERFARHCKTLLAEGCHGVALLGTTGEANSFGLDQRRAILDAAIASGIAADRLLPGTSACSTADSIALTRHAVRSGVRGAVLLPPFYYKGASDEGLFRFYAQVIEGAGSDALRVVLYHIPQVSQVPISHALIARLRDAFPGIVVGIKDSAGQLDNMQAMVRDFPWLGVLAGADPLLLPLLQAGGAGCITATSNLRPGDLRIIYDHHGNPGKVDEVTAAQARINAWRNLSNRYVQLPTIKAMLARKYGDQEWCRLRPPLVELSDAENADVNAGMAGLET